jgi:hypothetical protein
MRIERAAQPARRNLMRWFALCLGGLVLALMCSSAWAGEAADIEVLKHRVYAECPALRDGKFDEFARVSLLRQWAWSHIRIANTTSNLLDSDPRIDWYKLDAAAIFRLFDEDRGGVFCGGAALALQRLYEAFGYTAWTLNIGSNEPESDVTHVATIVKIRVGDPGGTDVMCVQDAYFDLTYVDQTTGRPLDYFELLARLARGEHRSIRTQEPDHRKVVSRPSMIMAAKDVQGRTPRDIAVASWCVLEDDYTVATLPDGSLKFTSPRSFGKFRDRLCRTPDGKPTWFLAWLTARGHPAELIYLYLHPLGIGGPDSDALLKRAKAIPEQGDSRGRRGS